MNRKNVIPATFAAMLLAGTVAGCAHASAGEDPNDATLLQQSKISLAEAISAAEQNTGAKATEARIDDIKGASTFKIMVVKDQAAQKVLVDAQTGQVLKVEAAKEGSEGEGDEEGDGEE